MLPVLSKQTASTYTRDGVRLDADIYYPDAKGEFPILLMRQPYGREIASTVVYAHPTWYAARGYIVVIQDVRGRGTSEGEFQLFAHEINDGEDTVNWAANLPSSNGKVGMYGFSYQGMTQLYAAIAKPAALKAICPAMIGYDLYTDWAYEGGTFCLHTNLAWAIQLATETARLKGDKQTYQALFAASRNLPLYNIEILKKLAPDSFYHDWFTHDKPDEYWQKLSPKTYFHDVDLPMFHIGGWFDTYLRGTLNLYLDITARSQCRQQLLVGPWAHIPWGRKVGEMDFGNSASSPVDEMQIRWFDQFLKDENTNLLNEPPVTLFEMGSNIWRHFPNFTASSQTSYFLSTTGLASIREDSGVLIQNQKSISVSTPLHLREREACPKDSAPRFRETIQNHSDVLVHDSWRPVPSLGGHASIPPGIFERSAIDCRSDVLTYTTAPLESDLYLLGNVVAEIYCQANKPSFDLCAVLSQIYTDGSVYNITQGYIHCENTQANTPTQPIKISLQPTCAKIPKGHALRLSLSTTCFPAYSTQQMEAEILTLTIHCGGSYPSHLRLGEGGR